MTPEVAAVACTTLGTIAVAIVKFVPSRRAGGSPNGTLNGLTKPDPGVAEQLCEARRNGLVTRMDSLEKTVDAGFNRLGEQIQHLADKID